MQILFLAIAGALGTVSRYSLINISQRVTGYGFPYGTLAVNFLGSLLIGFIMFLGLNSELIPRTLRMAITIGFLGAFTTFSTFSYETANYIKDGAWLAAGSNIALNVGISVIATLAGLALGRFTLGSA